MQLLYTRQWKQLDKYGCMFLSVLSMKGQSVSCCAPIFTLFVSLFVYKICALVIWAKDQCTHVEMQASQCHWEASRNAELWTSEAGMNWSSADPKPFRAPCLACVQGLLAFLKLRTEMSATRPGCFVSKQLLYATLCFGRPDLNCYISSGKTEDMILVL